MRKFQTLCYPVLFVLLAGFIGTALPILVNAQTATLLNVELNSKQVEAWCPVSISPNASCSKDGARIQVKATVNNPKNEQLVYNYVVSGGEILGQGPTVVWNLLEARPGNHSITVG